MPESVPASTGPSTRLDAPHRTRYALGMTTSCLRHVLDPIFGGAPFELSERGVYFHRNKPPDGSLRDVEQCLLSNASVRVLDFNDDASLVSDNVVSRDGAEPGAYEGVRSCTGHRLFRVDHHYDLPSLARTTTTCLTLSWLRGLWRRGAWEVLRAVGRSCYIANHADTDILLANYLAGAAQDGDVIHGPAAESFASASLRNDHIEMRDFGREAQKVFYACLGIEQDILGGALSFGEAQGRYLSQLEGWIGAASLDPKVTLQLDSWERQMRDRETRTLEAIAACDAQGGVRWELSDRLVVCEMDRRIDNADLYLYLAQGNKQPLVQTLIYPEAGGYRVKLRSHAGFDLNPLFRLLNERMPGAGFGGRATAGGSKCVDAVDRTALLDAVDSLMSG